MSLDGTLEGQAQAMPASATPAAPLCISLTGDSGIQFLSFAARRTALAGIERTFAKDGADENAVLQSFPPGAAIPQDLAEHAFTLDGASAADALLGEWLPVPCLRQNPQRVGRDDLPCEGPTNWARLRLVPDGTDFRLVLAFDTWLVDAAASSSKGAVSPTLDDARAGTTFTFAGDLDEIEQFISEPWIDDWITLQAVGASPQGPRSLTRLAAYITLLVALKSAGLLAPAVLAGSASGRIDASEQRVVDLSIMFGDSGCAAYLVDVEKFEDGAASAVTPLAVRDLDRPWVAEQGAMPAAVVFTRPQFGNDALSRLSGRPDAFTWPSLVRIGRPARDLCLSEPVGAAAIGRSDLIGSLLDAATNDAVWRIAGSPANSQKRQPFVSGPLLSLLTETGERIASNPGRTRATRARFSGSSLMSLAVQEIIVQAIAAINQADLCHSHVRRPSAHLRSILVTLPGHLQAIEIDTAHQRIRDGVALAFDALRWPDAARPKVAFAPLRALAVQYAYLHNEVAHRLAGRASSYLRLLSGPVRAAGEDVSVATVDVDASGVTLSVSVVSSDPDTHLKLTRRVEDTAGIGLDDAMSAIGRRIIVPALARHLEKARLSEAAAFLTKIMHEGRDLTDSFATRLQHETIMPAALRLLVAHQSSSIASDQLPVDFQLRSLLSPMIDHVALQRLQDLAVADGANATTLLDTTIVTTAAEVRAIVADTLGPVLHAACRVVRRHRCSLLLLAGHPAAVNFLRDAALREASVTPDRIVDLNTYRFGSWAGPAHDVAAVYAAGTALAARHTSATAQQLPQFVGFTDDVAIARVPMFTMDAGATAETAEQTHTFAYDGTSRVLGVAHINTPHWPLRPLARLDVSDVDAVRRAALPLTVTIALKGGTPLTHAALELRRVRDARGRQLPPSVLDLKVCTIRTFNTIDDAPPATRLRTEVRA